MKTTYTTFLTSFGWCGLVGSEQGLARVFVGCSSRKELDREMGDNYPRLLRVHNEFSHETAELKRYFSGEIPEFHCRLDFSGSTPFQRLVWDETGKIPYGKARTYSWIAERIGKAKAARAVGNALAKNPFPIIIPCHRVIKKDGRLGGFTSPAGIQLKKELLHLEGFDASYGEL